MADDQKNTRRGLLRTGTAFLAGTTLALGINEITNSEPEPDPYYQGDHEHPDFLSTHTLEFELYAGGDEAALQNHALYRIQDDGYKEKVLEDNFDEPGTNTFSTEQSEETYRWHFSTFHNGGDELKFRLYGDESVEIDLETGAVESDSVFPYTSDPDGPIQPPDETTTY